MGKTRELGLRQPRTLTAIDRSCLEIPAAQHLERLAPKRHRILSVKDLHHPVPGEAEIGWSPSW